MYVDLREHRNRDPLLSGCISALSQKRVTQTKIHQGKVLPKVTEKCPACRSMEAYYEEKQTKDRRCCIPYFIPSNPIDCMPTLATTRSGVGSTWRVTRV
ncbi:hypothetical protein EDC04DRAFT_1446915 [Pisolithus marmoratus]|nr:hypothetical protein EDC04DRAFT_1446915 [Pisolithus marmoratus]